MPDVARLGAILNSPVRKGYQALCDRLLPTSPVLGDPKTAARYQARWKKLDLELRLLTKELGKADWRESTTCKVSPE